MSPWVLAIVYDFVLWICRSVWHEIPIVGGRAQGHRRPRAPSLASGGRRRSFAEIVTGTHQRAQSHDAAIAELRRRDHQRKQSHNALEEDVEFEKEALR